MATGGERVTCGSLAAMLNGRWLLKLRVMGRVRTERHLTECNSLIDVGIVNLPRRGRLNVEPPRLAQRF